MIYLDQQIQHNILIYILSKSQQYSYFKRPQRGILGLLKIDGSALLQFTFIQLFLILDFQLINQGFMD
ncbi:unnamed protein product [Paramecium sonneborni]|uniref:Transmembrane protein n=1 Tax=Paramecium sonneborni TaxID=65129 RepID=A0A8S1P2C3_9CILI|nr:unnamed protein product [Paramecium sonneborni]